MSKVFEFCRSAFQSQCPAAEETLSGWERATGIALPGDYRRFMLTVGGGTLRPHAFAATETTTGRNGLSWADVDRRRAR